MLLIKRSPRHLCYTRAGGEASIRWQGRKEQNGRRLSPATRPIRVAIVLWNGAVGGAETLSVELARALRERGEVEPTVVFVGAAEPLAKRLDTACLAYESIGLPRGRSVLVHPRQFAKLVAAAGSDCAVLVECGFIAAALRAGGYRGAIVAVEHGPIVQTPDSAIPRIKQWVSRASGSCVTDAEVAVSDFVLERMEAQRVGARRVRIYNGVDPRKFRPDSARANSDDALTVVGFLGRLIPGKGADRAIQAIAEARREIAIRLLVAGDGPELERLRALAEGLNLEQAVEFCGIVDDSARFWGRCDLAVVPSEAPHIEACPMAVIEAMACGKPVIGTYNGGIPELIVPGQTGTLVPPSDPHELALAMISYARDRRKRRSHGMAARTRCSEQFHIDECARAYLDLFTGLLALDRL